VLLGQRIGQMLGGDRLGFRCCHRRLLLWRTMRAESAL
jgi:hypothetical protein